MISRPEASTRHRRQRGISLIIVLILLIAAVFLGASAAGIALMSEKAASGDRDRQTALQAAEAVLIDAERDIDTAPGTTAVPRTFAFSDKSAIGFPAPDDTFGCNTSPDSSNWGLCKRAPVNETDTWLAVDLTSTAVSVPYGYFTGQKLPVGSGALPSKLPRYIIELMPYNQPGGDAGHPIKFYRITAIGFGMRSETQVVVQSYYLKGE